MLVLTRRSDESLTLFLPSGDKMLIRIKDITGQDAKICIDAPKDVRIVRTEMMSRPGFNPLGPPPPIPQSPSRPTSPSPQPAN
jgi:carbon storage regulator CsrA